jgi:hypothetical protein
MLRLVHYSSTSAGAPVHYCSIGFDAPAVGRLVAQYIATVLFMGKASLWGGMKMKDILTGVGWRQPLRGGGCGDAERDRIWAARARGGTKGVVIEAYG